MSKYLLSLGLLCLASVAVAAEGRLTVDLNWENQLRTDVKMAVYKVAKIPEGKVTYRLWDDGTHDVAITFDDGYGCSTQSKQLIDLRLKCQTPKGYYWFTKAPKSSAQMEWIQPL